MSDMPPPPPPPPAQPSFTQMTAPVTSPAGVGKALWISFIVLAAVQGLAAIAHFQRASLASSIIDGDTNSLSSRVEQADSFVDGMTGWIMLANLTTFILLVIWMSKLTKTSRLEGGDFRRSNGWAVGGFFTPIGNLFIPYQFAVDNLNHYVNRGRLQANQLTQLNIWWFGFMGGFILNEMASSQDPTGFETLRTSDLLATGGATVMVLSAVFGFRVVKAFSDSQKALA